MRHRPLQFPTYVFNQAGEMRLCQRREDFDALGPGWVNSPVAVEAKGPGAVDDPQGDMPDFSEAGMLLSLASEAGRLVDPIEGPKPSRRASYQQRKAVAKQKG